MKQKKTGQLFNCLTLEVVKMASIMIDFDLFETNKHTKNVVKKS